MVGNSTGSANGFSLSEIAVAVVSLSHANSLAGSGGLEQGVAHHRVPVAVLEVGRQRRHRACPQDRLDQMIQLMDEGVLPAQDVPRRPPAAAVGVVAVGDEDGLEPPIPPLLGLRLEDLQLVQPLQVEAQASPGAVGLERQVVLLARAAAGGLQRPQGPAANSTAPTKQSSTSTGLVRRAPALTGRRGTRSVFRGKPR